MKRINYFAFVDIKNSPGVVKKIKNTCAALSNLGYASEAKLFQTSSELFQFISAIYQEKSDILFIRYYYKIFPFIIPALLLKRMQGKVIIIDVPTPRSAGIQEIKTSNASVGTKMLRIIGNYLLTPWTLWPATCVIQYADEGKWFSFGIKHKTIKMGNGIVISDDLPISQPPNGILHLVAVAQLAPWHGYDLLIKSIFVIKQKYPSFSVKVTIVGDGGVLEELKQLTDDLNLQEIIQFTGFLYNSDLDKVFTHASLGVASLALFRIGLNEASILKTREYLARGLCVIGTGKDPDFPENSPYRFTVSNNDNIQELADLIYSLRDSHLPSPAEVRQYAMQHLTLEAKLNNLLKGIDV